MEFGPVTPILRIFDEDKAREFYVDFLEFSVDWEHRFEKDLPLYMQVSKGDCLLHLSGHFGDGTPGSKIRIRMTGIGDYHQALLAKKYKHARPGLGNSGFGEIELCLTDPFGNRLHFFERIEEE